VRRRYLVTPGEEELQINCRVRRSNPINLGEEELSIKYIQVSRNYSKTAVDEELPNKFW
jgi:hypothetical protein